MVIITALVKFIRKSIYSVGKFVQMDNYILLFMFITDKNVSLVEGNETTKIDFKFNITGSTRS